MHSTIYLCMRLSPSVPVRPSFQVNSEVFSHISSILPNAPRFIRSTSRAHLVLFLFPLASFSIVCQLVHSFWNALTVRFAWFSLTMHRLSLFHFLLWFNLEFFSFQCACALLPLFLLVCACRYKNWMYVHRKKKFSFPLCFTASLSQVKA